MLFIELVTDVIRGAFHEEYENIAIVSEIKMLILAVACYIAEDGGRKSHNIFHLKLYKINANNSRT